MSVAGARREGSDQSEARGFDLPSLLEIYVSTQGTGRHGHAKSRLATCNQQHYHTLRSYAMRISRGRRLTVEGISKVSSHPPSDFTMNFPPRSHSTFTHEQDVQILNLLTFMYAGFAGGYVVL
jgi:hypothetical protein